MRPLSEIPATVRDQIRAVLFDIDDTITLRGHLPARAYQAIEQLHDAGLITIPITGRPAGWCDHIARMWPVDGIVGENGAFYFRYNHDEERMERRYWCSEESRQASRERLDRIAEEVLSEVPAARLSADQVYRESDLAIDVCEDIPPLSEAEIERIHSIFRRHGATAKLSSIHVNGWFGDYDKCSMTLRMLQEVFAITATQAGGEVLFVGDSPNDAPMFKFFPNSVGVANIRQFADDLAVTPRWITEQPGGLGFAELTDTLLSDKA